MSGNLLLALLLFNYSILQKKTHHTAPFYFNQCSLKRQWGAPEALQPMNVLFLTEPEDNPLTFTF